MDDAILYMSHELRVKAFDLNWAKLEASTTHLQLDALSLCVRLLPEAEPLQPSEPHEKLRDLVLHRLLDERQDTQHLYELAEACSSNTSFAISLFTTIHEDLERASATFSSRPDVSVDEHVRRTVTFITFLKCSFWLPPDSLHVISPHLLDLLLSFVGTDGLTEAALDAVSALLSLAGRRHQETIHVANPGAEAPWLKLDTSSGRFVLCQSLVNDSFWTHLKAIDPAHFENKSSKIFKIWFQWISQSLPEDINLEAVYEDLYWDRVRLGLLTGFADQRKYCLGIVRASLLAAKRDINTSTMRMQVDQRNMYVKAYDRYFILYEIIVLDRYANQLEACLPELSALFSSQSVVSASMATTLLSSALDPQVQEGIRKIVGNWYFNFISGTGSPLSKDLESLKEHTSFLIGGFLPWATQGSLFTSTLKSTRAETECFHGAALVNHIARFILSSHSDNKYREKLLVSILNFVLDTGGKMFQMSTLYLLEGLIKGYSEAAQKGGKSCKEFF